MKTKAPKRILWCQLLKKVVANKDKQNHCEVEFIRKGEELTSLALWIRKQPRSENIDFKILDEIERRTSK
jgi:hypothetical protein